EICWGALVEDPGKVNESWVREFYANLPTVVWKCREPVAYVRGRQILLTPTAINEALGLPNPLEEELKNRDVDENGQWLVVTLVVEEQRASINWGITRKVIQSTHFTVEARRWLNLVSQTICSSSNVTNVTYSRALVVELIFWRSGGTSQLNSSPSCLSLLLLLGSANGIECTRSPETSSW
ncbi:hypothetical protein HAX54_052700, partial [Datura stramonium]|nr:hypothetical protein [Datura stramonium]